MELQKIIDKYILNKLLVMNELSVAIPTYNRPVELMATLSALMPQIENTSVKVTVVDNASTTSIEGLLSGLNDNAVERISVIRNKVNIGLAANLIRALETAESDWIWLLGDDDEPEVDSIDRILSYINVVPEDICLIKFNSDFGEKIQKDYVLYGSETIAKFLSDPFIYSDFLFISSSIFNREKILKHTRVMYNFSGSLAPHVSAILACIAEGNGIIWKNEYISAHGVPENLQGQWDRHVLKSGFLKFADLDFDDSFVQIAMPHIYSHYLGYLGKNFYKKIFLLPFSTKQYSANYWRRYYFRIACVYKGFKMAFVLFCGVQITFLFKFNSICKYLRGKVYKGGEGSIDRS